MLKCWEYSKFVSTCANEIKCYCEDTEFQSVSPKATMNHELGSNLLAMITDHALRLFTNASTRNAQLLNLVRLFIMLFRNARPTVSATQRFLRL